ncbi:MAG: hypothetical protein LBF04_06665 [Prevotellaceae bacterium]|jgi:cell division protein FtsQ|nr:hypothetical protein [Prevotellaceae bacterium]
MNKTVKYILAIFTATAIVAYLLMAFVFVDNKEQALVCKNINITINNSDKFSFVDADNIKSVLLNCGEKIINEHLDKINTHKIKQILSKNHAIKSINVFTTIDANLNVEIEQRHPVVRIQCENMRCYIDDTGYIFPFVSSKPDLHLPVVTGTIPAALQNGFAGYIPKNRKFLNLLYEFAVFLKKNEFWNCTIEQIHVTNSKVELVPLFAGHIVKLGRLDNFKPKLNKLQKFYKYAMPATGWEKYKSINIEYKHQIICKK